MRIKTKILNEKDYENKTFSEGLDYFYNNCQRQGVELKHDPEFKGKKPEKAFFSIPSTMMKIRERTQ